MTYQDVFNQVVPSLLGKYGDSEKALQEFMKAQRKSIPIERINKELTKTKMGEAKYKGPLLQDKFTPEEKANRAALGLKIREKMARYAIARRVNGKQAEPLIAGKIIKESSKGKLANGDRYPEELMYDFSGTPEATETNAEISALFINCSDAATDLKEGEKNPYEDKFNELHKNLINRFEAYNVDDLVSRDLSDEELIEHFEAIEESKAICMQVENIRKCYKKMKISVPAKLEKKMNALVPKLRILEKYEQRLGIIDSPYYPEIDPEDPALPKIDGDDVAQEVIGDFTYENFPPEEFGLHKDEYSLYSSAVWSFNWNYYAAENEAIGEMMMQMGAKREDIAFEIDGKVADAPFYQLTGDGINLQSETVLQLQSGEIKSIRVFDKSEPTREIKIPRTEGKNYPFNKMRLGQVIEPETPQRPAEVAKPNFFKRWFNSWFGAFQKDVDDYAKYQNDVAAYNEKVAAKETLEETQRKLTEESRTARRNMTTVQPGHVVSQKDREKLARRFAGEEMESFEDIYGAEREYRKDWEQGKVYGDQAEAVKTGNISLEGISPNGKTLNNHQFAMMAAMCGLSNPFFDQRGEEINRITGKPSGLKLPPTITFEDLISTDMNPRAGLHEVLKNTIDPARRFLADCLKNFDKPMPGKEPATGREELAKTMTDGLKRYASRLKDRVWGNSADIATTEVGAQALDLAKELGMMDELKKNGLTEQELEDIAVARETARVKKDEFEAGYKIMQEAEGEIKLTEAERLDCLNKIAMGKAVQLETQLYGASQVPDMNEPEYLEGMDYEEHKDRSVNYGVQYAQAMEQIDTLKQISPKIKNLTKDDSELKKLAEKFLPEERRQTLAKGNAKDIFNELVGTGATTKYYDDIAKIVPPYEKIYLKVKVEGVADTSELLENKRQAAFNAMRDPKATPESLTEAAAMLLVCRTLAGTKFDGDAEKFDKGMEQVKSSEVFQNLAKNKESLKKIAGIGNERKMTETLLKSYKDERKNLEKIAIEAKETKQKTNTNEKKKVTAAVV